MITNNMILSKLMSSDKESTNLSEELQDENASDDTDVNEESSKDSLVEIEDEHESYTIIDDKMCTYLLRGGVIHVPKNCK